MNIKTLQRCYETDPMRDAHERQDMQAIHVSVLPPSYLVMRISAGAFEHVL